MIIALAGHVDHGKTALIQALTGIDADRLPEEKQRGMTIDLGFAHLRLPSGATVGFVDVPGHQRFLGNMLAGVLSIDTVLLVVAADDGPMPQTLEHLAIARLMGVTDVTAVITKIDRVEPARLEATREAVRGMLDRAGDTAAWMPDAAAAEMSSVLEAPPLLTTSTVLEVSSVTNEGIDALLALIERKAASHRARDAAGGFRLAIDRGFSPMGTGLVVTGTVASGTVSVGDRLVQSPSHLMARVRGIQVHNEAATMATAGDRCALAIAGPRIERATARRGDWLIDPALHAPTERIDAFIHAADTAGPRHAARVHIHSGAASLTGRALMRTGRDLEPGADGIVTLTLDQPGAFLYGDRLILRDETSGRVVAGGHVIDPFSPTRRIRRELRAATLAAHAIADPHASFRALLAADGWADVQRFRLARNLPATFTPEVGGDTIRIGSAAAPLLVAPETIARIGTSLTRHLADWHAANPDRMGPSKAALLHAAGHIPANVAEAILDVVRARGEIVRDGLAWRLPEHRPVLAPRDEAKWPAIHATLAGAALRPPRVRELAEAMRMSADDMTALLVRFERFGRLAGVAPNRYYLPETILALGDIAHALAAESDAAGFTAAEFNKRSGVGRNLTIVVLEYLDSIGVTRRIGDTRYVVRSAREALG